MLINKDSHSVICDEDRSGVVCLGAGVIVKCVSGQRYSSEERDELKVAPKFQLKAINEQKETLSEVEYGQMLLSRQAKLVLPKILSGKGPVNRWSKFRH